MNRLWLSLLIGAMITAFTALLLRNIERLSAAAQLQKKYEGELILKVDSINGSPQNFLLDTRDVLSRRLRYFGKKFTLAISDSSRIRISINGFFDSSSLRKMLLSTGEISIWELYSLNELPEWKTALKKAFDKPVPTEVPIVKDSTASPETQRLIDSIGQKLRKRYNELVEFPEPSKSKDGKNVYPPELLCMSVLVDSAGISQILHSPEIEALLPADAVPYYSDLTDKCGRALFMAKTRGKKTAPLNRDDIKDIYDDEFSLLPTIVIRFTEEGRKKLQKISGKDPRLPILLLRDNEVLMGTTVDKVGSDGKLEMVFSILYAGHLDVAKLLNAPKLRSSVGIESSTLQEVALKRQPLNRGVLVFCFIFFSALAFIIFKVLKNSPHRKRKASR